MLAGVRTFGIWFFVGTGTVNGLLGDSSLCLGLKAGDLSTRLMSSWSKLLEEALFLVHHLLSSFVPTPASIPTSQNS